MRAPGMTLFRMPLTIWALFIAALLQFRIFNPILQGEKFDKEGLYVKKWVPELNKVPNKFIHKPWEMELKYQQAIKTIIGKDYPQPIVIHEKARASALEAFKTLKK